MTTLIKLVVRDTHGRVQQIHELYSSDDSGVARIIKQAVADGNSVTISEVPYSASGR